MPTIDRRSLLGTAAAGLAGAGLVSRAEAAESPAPSPTPANQPIDSPIAPAATPGAPQQQPAALRGTVNGTDVTLPHLFADSELEGSAPNLDPPARRLGVAVVGLGHLALGQILPGFGTARHVRLAAVVSGDKAKGAAIADQHGLPSTGVYDYDTFDDIAHDRSIDIVYIVLPNSMHAEFTVRAARAGKHVLCEKPMATTVADAERMIAACRDAKRLLMIAYRLQYDPTHRLLIAATRSDEHGPVRYIEATYLQNNADNGQRRHIRSLAGGGSLPDVGLYCLNAARYVTGEEPVEITASVDSPSDDPRFREIEDFCRFSLRFPSGALANCTSAYSVHTKRTLSVSKPQATIVVDPAFDYTNLALRFEQKSGQTPSRDERRFQPQSQFATEMDAFALSIRAGTVPHTPGEEGLQDMKLMAAIYEAAGSGRTVKLPRVAGLDVTRGPLPA